MNSKQKEILIIIAIILGAIWFGSIVREGTQTSGGNSICDYGACGD